MTHSNQNHTKKASSIFAVAVILYAVIATYIYKNSQVNLMDYTTPVILWTVGIILTCAIVQRYFEKFLTSSTWMFLLAGKSYQTRLSRNCR